ESDVLSLDDNVVHGKLENGLSYYVRENEKPSDRVELRLVVDAGSVLEKEEERGLAHFVEHMAFNGTESYDKNSIVDYLERIGMKFGPDINAYTGFDETVYSLELPTDKEETVEKGFDILKEWAFRIAFDPEEVDKERGVIVEEWRSRRGASARLRDIWWPVLMEGSKYAERLPIGDMEVVRNAPPERLEGFYRSWYRPELMAVVVVGDLEQEKAVELVKTNFGGRESEGQERPGYEMPQPEERRIVVAQDPEESNIHIRLFNLHDSFTPEDEEEYADLLAIRMYRNMISTRLDELAREDDSPFINGYFSRGDLVRTKDTSVWGASAYEEKIRDALRALITEKRRVELFGFTEDELERAGRKVLDRMEQAYDERDKTESSTYIDEYVQHFLTGTASPGIEKEFTLAQEIIPEITLETMEDIHNRYMSSENSVVVITGPEKDDLEYPDEEEIDSIFREVDEAKVAPYSDDFEGESLIGEKPEPGEIVEEEHIENGDFYRFTLENGAQVVYKETDFKNDEVLFSAISDGGTSLVETDKYYAALLAPSFVGASGLGNFTPADIKKLLSGTQVEVRPYIDRYEEGFSGSASPEDLELLFQQLYLYYTDIRKDEGRVLTYRNRLASSIRNRRSRPEVKYQDEITRLLYEDHPRTRPLTSELVEDIEPEESFNIFEERFADPGGFNYFFVGNGDLEEIKEFSRTYLARLSEGRDESWKDRGVSFTDQSESSEVTAGKEPKSKVTLLFTGDYSWSLEKNHAIDSLKNLMEIRLREAVREEAGGTYGVSVSSITKKIPNGEYALRISYSCDPERVEELLSIVESELELLRDGNIEESYAGKVREQQRSDWEKSKEENSLYLGLLSASHRYGVSMEKLLDREKRIADVDPEMLTDTAQTYLKDVGKLRIILNPDS
ncbi:MAG: insulinase family protein, partial [Spirochaetia bacterium]